MLVASDLFKQAMMAPVKMVDVVVKSRDGDFEVSSSDNLMSTEIETSGSLFGTTTRQLSMKLLGVNYSLADEVLLITLRVCIDQSSNTWESLSLGAFYVQSEERELEKESTTVKAYDLMGVLANTPYDIGAITFPCTVRSLAEQLAQKFNFTMGSDLTTLPTNDYEISEDLWAKISNTTYRDVMSQIAGATATTARFYGESESLVLQPLPNSSIEQWTYDNIKTFKNTSLYGPVNSLVLARTPQEDNIALSDSESIEVNGLTEVKLANNEILDDDRQDLAQSIFDAIKGFGFTPFEADTEGHGWHEVGDRIDIINGEQSWSVVVTYIKLTIDGGIKEQVKGIAPSESSTNYALAGGIKKTVYNTEIKVDKQNQEITSVVSKQEQIDQTIINNYTEIKQDIANITTTIQESGGANIIYNSVGYDTDSATGALVDWETTGVARSVTSPESLSYGAISGNQITLGASSKIVQRIVVDGTGSEYSFAAKVKKGITGLAKIRLVNEHDDFSIALPDGEESTWKEFVIRGLKPTMSYLDVTIETDESVTDFAITDLIVNVGTSNVPWVQASGETLNTQVAITKNGVKVKSSVYSGDYVEITPLEFAGYSTASGPSKKVFSLNRDTTVVQKLHSEQQIDMPPIKIVPILNGDRKGWAFVQTDN